MRGQVAACGIAIALAGCAGAGSNDGPLSTSVGQDTEYINYDQPLSLAGPTCNLNEVYDLVVSGNVEEIDMQVRKGGKRDAITWQLVPKDPHPLQVMVNVVTGNDPGAPPVLELKANATEVLVFAPLVNETATLTVEGYLQPLAENESVPLEDAGAAADAGTAADAGSDAAATVTAGPLPAGLAEADLADILSALRCGLVEHPQIAGVSRPAFFLNQSQSSVGGGVVSYSQDGANLISWNASQTLVTAYALMGCVTATVVNGNVVLGWSCATSP